MEKLAINGGSPVRTQKIFYGRQWVDEKDVEAVSKVLTGDLITCGPKVEEMERTLEKYTGAKHAVAVSNGTAALHCACIAAGVGPGDEVITTPITFAASANCALYCGATPVFADINPETYAIDPDSIRSHITDRTKAIVAVDFTGQAVQIDEIRQICDEYNLIFIEDAAHSIATKYKGKQVGSLADMTCKSRDTPNRIQLQAEKEEQYLRMMMSFIRSSFWHIHTELQEMKSLWSMHRMRVHGAMNRYP